MSRRRDSRPPVILRAACRLLPRARRDELTDDMLAVFERERDRVRRQRGRALGALFTLRTTAAVVGDGLRLRLGGRGVAGFGPGPGFLQDLRHALRTFRTGPGYAAAALLSLALGIGVSTAMFSVVANVLLEPLPHPGGERLVRVWRTLPQFDWRRGPVSYPNFVDWRQRAGSFEALGAFSPGVPVTYRGGQFPERVDAGFLTPSMLPILGITPELGRAPVAGEEGAVALVSHEFWQRHLGGDPGAPGRLLSLEGFDPVLVGVLPAGTTTLPEGIDVWMPVTAAPEFEDRGSNFLHVLGRLRPGVSQEIAQSEMEGVVARLAAEHPETAAGAGVRVEDHRDFLLQDVRALLWILAGCAGLTLAVVCANLAGLTLTRAVSRGRELAVRAALGAGGARIARQLLTESALLGLAGGALGTLVAHGLVDAFLTHGPRDMPRRGEIAVDPGALAFAVATSLLVGLLFGLLPALRAARVDPSRGLRVARGDGTDSALTAGGHRAQRALVVGQVAVAAVLLVVAGLLAHSFVRLATVDPGFDPEGVLSAHVPLPEERYDDPERVAAFFEDLLRRLETLPGVRGTGATWALPFRPTYASGIYTVEGQPVPEGTELLLGMIPVRGDYFRTMGIPLLRGRPFGPGDDAGAPPVAIVNETMAERHWADADPVGKRFLRGDTPVTVVGVVPDVKQDSLAADPVPEAYLPHDQAAWAGEMYVVLRSGGDLSALARGFREILRDVDPALPVAAVSPVDELVADSLAAPRFRTGLIGGFALLALLLAALGVYGVVRLLVQSRTREIGVRMALGAGQRRVLGQVVGSGVRLAVYGLLLGIPAALLASRALETLVFGVATTDPATYATVALALVLLVGLASWLPARRASRIDPTIALRGD